MADPLMGFGANDPPTPTPTPTTPPKDPLMGFGSTPDPTEMGVSNVGKIASAVGEWARPKEDLSVPGAKQTAADLGRTALNTFGTADQLGALGSQASRANLPPGVANYLPMMFPALFAAGAVAPSDLKPQQAESAAARERLGGGLSLGADMAGYAPFGGIGPYGGVGIAKDVSNSMGVAAPVFRKIVGQGVEGGVAGGTAAAGHDQDVATGAGVGAATSLLAAPITGLGNWLSKNISTPVGRMMGVLSTPEEAIATTNAAKTAAYHGPGGTDDYEFDSWHPIAAYTGAKASLTGPQQQGLSDGMNNTFAGHVSALGANPTASATDIDGYGRRLANAATTPDDKVLAARVKDNLDFRMGAAPTATGQPIGSALVQVEAARQAAQQNIMAKGIQGASTDLSQKFYSPAPWADQQSEFYKPGTPGANPQVYDALTGLIRSTGTGYDPHTASMLASTAAEGAGGAVAGPGGAIASEAAVRAAHPLIKGFTKALQRGSAQNQLAGLWGPATGQPTTWQPGAGELIRQAALASEAGRGY
jgi:hypothetical protein